jgi:hypothetical protein
VTQRPPARILSSQFLSAEFTCYRSAPLRSSLRDAAPPCGSPWLRSFSPAEVLGCAALPCEVPWLRSSSLRRSLVAQRSPAKSLGCAALPCGGPWLRSAPLRSPLVAQLFPAETLDFADVPAETLGFADVPAETLGFADVPADYPDNAERVLREDVSPTSLGS